MTYAQNVTNRLGRPAGDSGLLLPLRQIFDYAGRFLEARRGRREIAQLARSEDEMLADIGIARTDVEWALNQPWNADPSLALATRVSRRKAASRWARDFQVS
jgi:uncharacterized protein YjiS (DUF1127 family)